MTDEIRYGGFWRRFFALIVDTVIWYTFFFCFLLLVFPAGFIYLTETGGIVAHFPEFESALSDAATGSDFAYYAPPLVNLALSLIFTLMLIGYFAGMESSSRQATYGKMMFGLKVTDQHAFRIGFWHAFGRYFAKALSVLTIFIGFLMAAFTEKKQALHDIVCKTLIIREGSCFIWPTFKVILLSILFTVLVFAGAGVYTYTKYGNIFYGETEARKKIAMKMATDFFGMDIYAIDKSEEGNKQKESTSADGASNFVPTDTPIEKREDGLIYKINEDSPYTGENHTYYESGQKKEESHVLEGQFHGPLVAWHENGQIKETTNYEKGLVNGAYVAWYENGNKRIEANFLKNAFEGPYINYFENGQTGETGSYKEGGLLHGQIIFWDDEGNFTESRIYENGELLETSTTPPENLSEVVNSLTTDSQDYEAPAPTEETFDLENNNDTASLNIQLKESFHENGQKKMEAHYADGKLDGSSTLWNEYGQKIIIVNYKEDKRHGLLTRWYNNGQKKIEINYTDNKRDGKMTFWHENGDIKKTLTYNNGEKND
jgi:antitoxin component YwqK of YwqJK toxin-antitoxin module/uncharacterized RDD family membrane protein YckC